MNELSRFAEAKDMQFAPTTFHVKHDPKASLGGSCRANARLMRDIFASLRFIVPHPSRLRRATFPQGKAQYKSLFAGDTIC